MQSGYATLGKDGGSRCRYCAGKIDFSDSAGDYNVTHLPHVKVYNAAGGLVGSVTGTDIDKVKSYVVQAKSG